MRGSTVLLTGEAVLVAAMVGRMGWVNWFAVIHATLCIGLALTVALAFILVIAAICIGLPLLAVLGIARAVAWPFRPATFGNPA